MVDELSQGTVSFRRGAHCSTCLAGETEHSPIDLGDGPCAVRSARKTVGVSYSLERR